MSVQEEGGSVREEGGSVREEGGHSAVASRNQSHVNTYKCHSTQESTSCVHRIFRS